MPALGTRDKAITGGQLADTQSESVISSLESFYRHGILSPTPHCHCHKIIFLSHCRFAVCTGVDVLGEKQSAMSLTLCTHHALHSLNHSLAFSSSLSLPGRASVCVCACMYYLCIKINSTATWCMCMHILCIYNLCMYFNYYSELLF